MKKNTPRVRVLRHFCVLVLLLSFLAGMGIGPPKAYALYVSRILDKSSISRLNNEELIDYYIELMVDLDMSNAIFRDRQGTNPSDLMKRRGLFEARAYVILEMEKRKIEVPPIELPNH